MNYKENPLKVHLFHDNSKERDRGKPWMKNIFCRGNSGQVATGDPKQVTCKRCLVRMRELEKKLPDSMFNLNTDTIRQLEIELEDEKLQSEVLWGYLKLAYENLDDREHVIIIPGTQISLGTIITAAILGYRSRKKLIEDGTYEWDGGN